MTINPIKESKTQMTAASTQILFIDVQPEIVAGAKTNTPQRMVDACVAVAKLGRLYGLPIHASVVNTGMGEPRLVPELAEIIPDVTPLVRTMAPVFEDGPTTKAIEAAGRRDLIVCGIVTEVAVLLAAFGAVARGYEVHIPVDACAGITQRTEEAAFRRIESFDANTASTATLGALLAMDLGSPKGRETMQILKTHVM